MPWRAPDRDVRGVYPHWRGAFYPPELPTGEWLPYYAERFRTVELNNSFYRLPSEGAFSAWAEATPAGFRFSVKASRYLTHVKKLREPEGPLLRLLGEKLEPVLHQLPPRRKYNLARLRAFLGCLPPDLTHALEFRDPTWINDQVLDALREHHAGLYLEPPRADLSDQRHSIHRVHPSARGGNPVRQPIL